MPSSLLKAKQIKNIQKDVRPHKIIMSKEKTGLMFILSSPSGAGKTTLTKKIAENNPDFKISISHTTRKPRVNEIDGKDYHFVNELKFNELIKKNDFFEYAKIFDNY